MSAPQDTAARLGCWKGKVQPRPLSGGISNHNFLVEDQGEKFFVRIGDDVPVHNVMRFNERAASHAAHAAGLSPEVVWHEPGAMVLRYLTGRTLQPEEVAESTMLHRIVPLVRSVHTEIVNHLRGPVLTFWVFHACRDYAARLREEASRMAPEMPRLMEINQSLEEAVGAIDLRFGHNDLLAANFLDDGERLWLVDWEYGGFNSPLFDLANLASNNALIPAQEDWLLEAYYEKPVTDELRLRYRAMKCGSLLRESMWSMVSELHSSLDFDYVAYTTENLARFEQAWAEFQAS